MVDLIWVGTAGLWKSGLVFSTDSMEADLISQRFPFERVGANGPEMGHGCERNNRRRSA